MTTGDPTFTTTSTGNGSILTSTVVGTIGATQYTTINPSYLTYPPAPSYATEDDIKKVDKRLAEIEDRLSILRIDENLHTKYPALREAYEAYKIIEALVKDSNVHK